MSFTSLGPAGHEFSVIGTGFLHYGGVGKEMFEAFGEYQSKTNCISIILTGNVVNLKAFNNI